MSPNQPLYCPTFIQFGEFRTLPLSPLPSYHGSSFNLHSRRYRREEEGKKREQSEKKWGKRNNFCLSHCPFFSFLPSLAVGFKLFFSTPTVGPSPPPPSSVALLQAQLTSKNKYEQKILLPPHLLSVCLSAGPPGSIGTKRV